jgi:hypothetical protein
MLSFQSGNFINDNSQNISPMKRISTYMPFKTNEESSLDFFGLNRLISEADIKQNPTILMEELEGDILRNNKLLINAGGLTCGARKIKDGVSFFGPILKNVYITILLLEREHCNK